MADFVQTAREAGYTDAEIEQHLAMSGRSPAEVRAILGPKPLDPVGMLTSGVRRLMGTEDSTPPQAMTRVTHTPVRWGGQAAGSFGSYRPLNDSIRLDPERLPQWNPPEEYLSNILRHEQVHALQQRGDVIPRIQQYFDQNPALAAVGRTELSRLDDDAGGSNRGLATEAPAYAVQGYRFGLGDDIVDQYRSRMPAGAQKKYDRLLKRK
jgi:hypothetical protein